MFVSNTLTLSLSDMFIYLLFSVVSPSMLTTSTRRFTMTERVKRTRPCKHVTVKSSFLACFDVLFLPAMMMARGSSWALWCRRFGPGWTGAVRPHWFCPEGRSGVCKELPTALEPGCCCYEGELLFIGGNDHNLHCCADFALHFEISLLFLLWSCTFKMAPRGRR